jgi:hypothetical protein
MGTLPRTKVRIIELLRGGPRDRAGIAGALKLRESVTACVLTAMEFRQIVLKEGHLYSLPTGTASQDIAAMAHTLGAKIEALIGDAREAHHNDRTIAAALEEAATALRAGLT